ncbi:MAG: EamA family transporter [Methylomonas sp.]|nr:MAG: EamA family transporter [Methylomonas sp.]
MRLVLAFVGVVLIWTTTPLGIKWSSVGVSFIFGVTARMSIGLFCLLIMMLLTRTRLRLDKAALITYVAVSIQVYASMLLTYWGAQFIPSGWLSVIFGLSPFMTAFMAAAVLKEQSLGIGKILSYLIGVTGLAVMFSSAFDLDLQAAVGMVTILVATFLHAISAIWVKKIHAQLPAMAQITGGLLLSLPLYFVTWYWLDQAQLPDMPTEQTIWAILYLGLIATPIGFALYYYVLARLPATNVAMINLMTPVLSLILGYFANQEALTTKVLVGTGLIMLALGLHSWLERRQSANLQQSD